MADDRARGLADYRARCRKVYTAAYARGSGKVPAGDLAALLLSSTALKENSDWKERAGVAHLFGSRAFRAAVTDRKTGSALRRLLLAWAGSRPADDVVSHQCFLSFVQSAKFKEGLPAVRRLIRDPNQSVDALLGGDGPFEKAFAEAVQGKTRDGQQLSYGQWREAIAHVLFNTSDDYQRTLNIVGAVSYAREVDGEASALAAMVPTIEDWIAGERSRFEVEHRDVILEIRGLTNRLRDQQTTLARHRAQCVRATLA